MFLPITTQSTQAPTTSLATSVPRFDLKRVADKAELPDSNNDLESRLSSLLAGNHTLQSLLLGKRSNIRKKGRDDVKLISKNKKKLRSSRIIVSLDFG